MRRTHRAVVRPTGLLALPTFLLLTISLTPPAAAGVNHWTTGGPYGGDVGVLVVDPATPTTLYAGTDEGKVFKSTNAAASWVPASRGLHGMDVRELVVDPHDSSVLYAAIWTRGVFKSVDAGGRWQAVNHGVPADTFVWSLALADSFTLYAGTFGRGVLKSTDGGERWRGSSSGLPPGPARDVRGLSVDPTNPSTVYAATAGGVFKSSNAGASWSPLGSVGGLTAEQVLVDPEAPSTLYVVVQGANFYYRSTNGGASFTLSFAGDSADVRYLAFDPEDSSTLYAAAGVGSRLYKSTNGGDTWTGSIGVSSTALTVAVAPGGSAVYAGTAFDQGVFKSTDGGAVFSPATAGLNGMDVRVVVARVDDPDVLFAGHMAGVSRSLDGGLSWTALPLAPDFESVTVGALAIDPVNPQRVYAGGQGAILRTVDGGDSWSVAAEFDVETLAVDPTDSGRVYAGAGSTFLVSPDGGTTWEERSGLPPLNARKVGVTSEGAIFVLSVGGDLAGRVSRSLDGGATWQAADSGLAGRLLTTLALSPGDPAVLYAGGPEGIFRSQDGGASWQGAGSDPDLASVLDLVIDPASPSTVYAAGQAGVFKTVDAGNQWFPVEALPGRGASLALSASSSPGLPGTLHAGTFGSSIYSFQQDFACNPVPHTLCIDDQPGDRRFRVGLTFDTSQGGGQSGQADTVPLAPLGISRGGVLSFGDPANPELLVKVLNGCSINGRYWVFSAATTNVGFRLSVTDNASGVQRVYDNLDRTVAETITDVRAFETCGGNGLVPRSPLASEEPAVWDSWESATSKGLGPCVADVNTLCVDDAAGDGRFRVTASYDTVLGGGQSGPGRATSLVPLGISKGGIFSFTDPTNPEVLIKVLNGCAITGHYWVFAAATTTVGFELRVEDTQAGIERVFTNPDETAAEPLLETRALATCTL